MKLFLSVFFSLALVAAIGLTSHVSAQVAGCTTTGGYNPVTGMSCNSATSVPPGCSSTAGFSSSTGTPCNSNTTLANGYDGNVVGANGYLNGCTSLSGFSTTTGYSCNAAINGIIYDGPNGTVNIGLPGTVTTPSLPTTGGQNAIPTMILLIGAATLAAVGVQYSFRHSAK